MNTNILLLIFCLIVFSQSQPYSFDLSQVDKHGNVLSLAPCNKDTVIDFYFSPDTRIRDCTTTSCAIVI